MTSTPDLTGVGCGGSQSSLGNGGSGSPILLEPHNNNTQSIADYLAQLLKDKKQLAAFPNVFLHVERLLDDGKTYLPFSNNSSNNKQIKFTIRYKNYVMKIFEFRI